MTSIHPDTIIPPSLDYIPLTTDNLMKKAHYESTSIPPTVLVEQYCQDMMMTGASPNTVTPAAKRRKPRSTSTSSHKIRPSSQRRQSSSIKSSTSTTTRDNTVMESPRLLPFPYHNDSLFLPTVEHHRRMERAKSVASMRSSSSFGNPQQQPLGSSHLAFSSSARSSAAFSASLPPPPSPKRQRSAPPALSRRPNVLQPEPFRQVSSLVPVTHYQQKRDKQHVAPSSSPESIPSRPTKPSPKKQSTSSTFSYSWLRRVWKLLKNSSLRQRLSSSTKEAMATVVC